MTFGVVNRLRFVLVVVGSILLIGTLGYVFVEGWTLWDGLFMTLITLSTVGYGETHELTTLGRVFTSFLILLCLIGMTYWTAVLTSFVVEADLSGRFIRRKVLKMIAKLKQHVIVCGSNDVAQAVVERLTHQGVSVVLIDDHVEQIQQLQQIYPKLKCLQGKPSSELMLADANVFSAKAIVAATESEVDNLLIGMTCKELDPKITVLAKSNDAELANRMVKAGIDEVISPSLLCGNRVAELISS